MIDTHCHLTFPQLDEHLDEVLERAREAGVDRMICVATNLQDANRAVEIADQHPHIFATVGVHPHNAADYDEQDEYYQGLKQLAHFIGHPQVKAMGEMGLDLHYDEPSLEVQKRTFRRQLELADEFSHLPIIIHNREATQQTIEMIREVGVPGERFVFHCFTGGADELEQILALGAMVSFTGIVTFGSARDLAEASDRVPLDRLMVETDSPYLTPEPHRKVRPNEPCYVVDVARFLAQRREMDFDEFVAAVDANAERFFRLPEAS